MSSPPPWNGRAAWGSGLQGKERFFTSTNVTETRPALGNNRSFPVNKRKIVTHPVLPTPSLTNILVYAL